MYIQSYILKIKTKTKVSDKIKTKTYNLPINCYTKDTSYGFKHIATLYNKEFKCCYYNRSWERFQYESVLKKALEFIETDYNIKIKNYSKFLDKNLKKIN